MSQLPPALVREDEERLVRRCRPPFSDDAAMRRRVTRRNCASRVDDGAADERDAEGCAARAGVRRVNLEPIAEVVGGEGSSLGDEVAKDVLGVDLPRGGRDDDAIDDLVAELTRKGPPRRPRNGGFDEAGVVAKVANADSRGTTSANGTSGAIVGEEARSERHGVRRGHRRGSRLMRREREPQGLPELAGLRFGA